MTAFFADSHPGHKRSHNEDSFEADADRGLWLVADGVGGHANGEIASAIVRDTLVRDLAAGELLVDAIRHSHQEILNEIAKRPSSNMGSTVVAMHLEDNDFEIAWVGDSRAYLFDGEKLRQLTRDHNPVSEMLARGAITPEQAAQHPERNVLSQSLGVSDSIQVNPERVRGEMHRGEQILLCSDGLTDELSDAQITQLLREHATPQAQGQALVKAALDAGGRDNVTVVIVGASASAPGHAQSFPALQPGEDAQFSEESARTSKRHDRLVWVMLTIMVVGALFWMLR
ncbi:serine/threonine-protein phosphatase [Mangrovimicrobium sediminis]|uniref:Serine/threonine-protein phosphatase n=1 Tax=Mangrovimicrobium sediminis TaxID=2562682 RepID=A0A4Z0M5J2_9GAMM|nr:protein phosphatase 2C domain-containing protein [Haliea sp. SAOS-164]TGD74754.1 serine/threonine-protein phosphatase [Haliea sp. SAOS-164]